MTEKAPLLPASVMVNHGFIDLTSRAWMKDCLQERGRLKHSSIAKISTPAWVMIHKICIFAGSSAGQSLLSDGYWPTKRVKKPDSQLRSQQIVNSSFRGWRVYARKIEWLDLLWTAIADVSLWVQGPIMSRRHSFVQALPNLWLLQFFCPCFHSNPQPFQEGKWYRCPHFWLNTPLTLIVCM